MAMALAMMMAMPMMRPWLRRSVALIKFTDVGAVPKALALAGTQLGGRPVRVEPARKKPKRAPSAAGAGATAVAGGAGRAPREPREPREPKAPREPKPKRDLAATVWLGNVPAGTDEEAVKAATAKFGAIASVFVSKERP